MGNVSIHIPETQYFTLTAYTWNRIAAADTGTRTEIYYNSPGLEKWCSQSRKGQITMVI